MLPTESSNSLNHRVKKNNSSSDTLVDKAVSGGGGVTLTSGLGNDEAVIAPNQFNTSRVNLRGDENLVPNQYSSRINVRTETTGGEAAVEPEKTAETQEKKPEKVKSKRPKESRFHQQRLHAWQPVLTTKTAIPFFIISGLIFIVLGAIFVFYSNGVNEFTLDYTSCVSTTDGTTPCSSIANYTFTCYCSINFQLTSDYGKPVYLYYGLSNFYQNHRLYIKSRDDKQLIGGTGTSVSSTCSPYSNPNSSTVYAPCGAIANSLFNDSFALNYYGTSSPSGATTAVPLVKTGIAWDSDVRTKFANPPNWDNTVKPKNWQKNVYELDTSDANNNGYKNQDLIVWMRTAALPWFRKFYRLVDHTGTFAEKLPAGYYNLYITYNYPVTSFGGHKYFYISTTSWIGGKNPFLGIGYLVVGCLNFVIGLVFIVVHIIFECNKKKTKIDTEVDVIATSTDENRTNTPSPTASFAANTSVAASSNENETKRY